MRTQYIGAPLKRREDHRLLTGRGRYVDDIRLPNMLYASFVRSPHAHARLRRIDATAAQGMCGVAGVFTYERLARWMKPLPPRGRTTPALARAIAFTVQQAPQYPMCRDRARYAGEIVAMVVASSAVAAENAALAVEVDYDPLPAVVNVLEARGPSAPRLHDEWTSNVALEFSHTLGDPDMMFERAAVRVAERFRIQRYVGMPIEPRGVIAAFDPRDGSLTTWNSTQIPHFQQDYLAAVFDMPLHRVRVIAPDVGGGFGTKANGYAEDVLIPLAAHALDRPVKWIEGRREHFLAAAQARDQVHDIEIAADPDGTILGVRDDIVVDVGAYHLWNALPYNTVGHLLGPLRIRHLGAHLQAVVTNKMIAAPYRGAGRPEAVFAVDRILDRLARALRMDPAALRLKNYLRQDELPYDVGIPYLDGSPAVYDSGDYQGALKAALDASGYEQFRREQPSLRRRGVYRGIGISGYVEGTGLGPWESACVRVDASGHVVAAVGAASQGQGHETTFAQLVAETLDVPVERVSIVGGDTSAIPYGMGTYASRAAVLAGNSLTAAAREVRGKLARAAAGLLEAAEEDIEFSAGSVSVRGVPGSDVPLSAVVRSLVPTSAAGARAGPDFEASAYFTVPTVTFASGVHIAEVEVDIDSGGVRILRYIVVHDCGRVINPLIVEGQIHGGVAQGIGGGLWEALVFDDAGQLLTASLMDYAIPSAAKMPSIDTLHLSHDSPRNPLGIKGVGEGGAISPPAAIANAVEDALAPFDVCVTETPVTPARIYALLRARRPA